MRYEVYEGYVEELQKKVTRIQNKIKRYGGEFKFEIVGETFKKVVVDPESKIDVNYRYVVVEAEGLAKVNGWEFIAAVDHTPEGNIFRKAALEEEFEIPERYRLAKPYCEHCNRGGYRKNTFIIRNTETGEFKQVGRNCLCDYTRGMSVEFATFMASLRSLFEEETYAKTGSGDRKIWYDTDMVLRLAAEWIRHYGYQKTTDQYGEYNPNSTKRRVNDLIRLRTLPEKRLCKDDKDKRELAEKVGYNEDSDEAKELVKNALEWVRNSTDNSDYINNLKVIAKLDAVEYKHIGYLCALIQSYRRDAEKIERKEQEKKENALSQYMGAEGDRVEFKVVSAECVACWDTQFGSTYIYKFKDEKGNIAIWKTGNHIDAIFQPAAGYVVESVKGTIKDTEKYNGVKQTVLTRCKVTEGKK